MLSSIKIMHWYRSVNGNCSRSLILMYLLCSVKATNIGVTSFTWSKSKAYGFFTLEILAYQLLQSSCFRSFNHQKVIMASRCTFCPRRWLPTLEWLHWFPSIFCGNRKLQSFENCTDFDRLWSCPVFVLNNFFCTPPPSSWSIHGVKSAEIVLSASFCTACVSRRLLSF